MNQTVSPGPRTGSVRIPASKSQAHRLLICAALGAQPVAAMSAETPSHRSATGCAPRAAQMSRRCACDFEAGMRTLPVRGPGETV